MSQQICNVCKQNKINIFNSEKIKNGKICSECELKLNIQPGSIGNKEILQDLTASIAQQMITDGEIFNEPEELKDSSLEKEVEVDPKLKKIVKELEEAGVYGLFGTNKEILSLPNLVDDDEKIIYATSGFVDSGTVLVVLTNNRLMFIDKGMLYGTNYREIPFSKINGVSYSTKLLLATIRVDNGVNTTIIKNVPNETAPIFVKKIKDVIDSNNTGKTQQTFSVADELTKFKSLLDAGLLTQDEFDSQKQKLLNN